MLGAVSFSKFAAPEHRYHQISAVPARSRIPEYSGANLNHAAANPKAANDQITFDYACDCKTMKLLRAEEIDKIGSTTMVPIRHNISLDRTSSSSEAGAMINIDLSDAADEREQSSGEEAVAAVGVTSKFLDFRGMRDLECSLLVLNAADPPRGKVADQQGYGGEFYNSHDGALHYPTATELLSLRVPSAKRSALPKPLSNFYNEQNGLIDDLIRMEQYMHSITADIRNDDKFDIKDAFHYHNAILKVLPGANDGVDPTPAASTSNFWNTQVYYAVLSSTILNFLLAIMNAWLVLRTGSLSVATSTVDTVLDLVTSAMLNAATALRRRPDPYNYPYGRARLEPIGILVFAVVMGMASLAIVGEAVDRLSLGPEAPGPHEEHVSFGLLLLMFGINLMVKFTVISYCTVVASRASAGSSTCETIAKEQRYDLMTYTGTFAVAIIASFSKSNVWFLDPAIAIILSFYIGVKWISDARKHVQQLVGKSASQRFIRQLIYLTLRHDSRIQYIDDVKAVHFGENFMVEVHIGLPATMQLKESHDIVESLQIKFEGLPGVELAHVHADYVYCHKWKEHKVTRSHDIDA